MVSGYQADVDFTNTFVGIPHEEQAHGILAHRGDSATRKASGKKFLGSFTDGEVLAAGINARTKIYAGTGNHAGTGIHAGSRTIPRRGPGNPLQ